MQVYNTIRRNCDFCGTKVIIDVVEVLIIRLGAEKCNWRLCLWDLQNQDSGAKIGAGYRYPSMINNRENFIEVTGQSSLLGIIDAASGDDVSCLSFRAI